MIVHHSGRLHKAYMIVEPTKLKPRFLRSFDMASLKCRFAGTSPSLSFEIDDRFAADKSQMYSSNEPNSFCTGEERLCIRPRRPDLQPVADDSLVKHQFLKLCVRKSATLRIKPRKRLTIGFAFSGAPCPNSTRPESPRYQKFKQQTIVMNRHAPFES